MIGSECDRGWILSGIGGDIGLGASHLLVPLLDLARIVFPKLLELLFDFVGSET